MNRPSSKQAGWPYLALIPLGLLPGWWVLGQAGPLVDERQYWPQVLVFVAGQFELHPDIPAMPGFHLAVANISRIFGVESLPGFRAVALGLSLLTPLAFLAAARELHDPHEAARRCAQLFFLPVAYPYFFLLYTDLFALFPLLVALYLVLQGRLAYAGLVGSLCLGLRQTHVLWLLFLFVLAFHLQGRRLGVWRDWLQHLRQGWTFVLGGALFLVFVLVNGGVALGDRAMHQAGKLRLENVYFSLLVFAACFLPLLLSRLPAALRHFRQRPLLWLIPGLASLPYLLFFAISHPYNEVGGYLHNMAMAWITASPWQQLLAYLPMAAVMVALAVWPSVRGSLAWLYPFWFLGLLPFWMVEPRYVLPALVLFLLLHRSEQTGSQGRWVAHLNLTWQVLCCLGLLYAIRGGHFFL